MLSAHSTCLRRQFQLSPHGFHDFSVRLLGSAARVHHDHTLGFAGCDRQVGSSHPPKKSTALLLEAVLIALSAATLACLSLVAASRTIHAHGYVRIHQDGELRPQITAQDSMQFQHRLAPQLAPATLICFRRISEAVAEHDSALSKRGLDDLGDVLRA